VIPQQPISIQQNAFQYGKLGTRVRTPPRHPIGCVMGMCSCIRLASTGGLRETRRAVYRSQAKLSDGAIQRKPRLCRP
jgi:hypothetical protein